MDNKSYMPDGYISKDLPPAWKRQPCRMNTLEKFRFLGILKNSEDFEKMSFCSSCGRPLFWDFNKLTGEIVATPCEVCEKRTPMDKDEKTEYIAWLKRFAAAQHGDDCLRCSHSMSGDDEAGNQILVCMDCPGHEGEVLTVDENSFCLNFN